MEELIKWEHTIAALKDYAEFFMRTYKDNLYIENHIATGDLMSKMDYVFDVGTGKIEVSLRLEDYWKYIEYDTKPHYPPYKAILDWVKVKFHGNLPNGYDGELPVKTETLEKRFAYFTQQKIGEHGTTGTHPMQEAGNEAYAQFNDALEQAISQDIDEAMDVILLTAFSR